MAAPLIWINAFPGTGKLTIAKAIKSIGASVTIIDNHQLIDPVAWKFSRDDPCYQIERKRERERAFQRHVQDPTTASETIIFTDFQTDNELGRSVAYEYQTAAITAGRPFIPIYLECDLEVNIERATSQERVFSTTTKLTDPILLQDFRSKCRLFEFEGLSLGICVDTTNKDPSDIAKIILKYLQEVYKRE
ncbi:uncharacterized protein TrAFT101_010066 [Trichoderma asperellum]|uniref:Uncharacterized protein n=1 Tax=Trichoderma asperellum (strain ATCC 204424 / CBS 433.97 / NBRC 101777) TaxID=1042311 RepID=A0A2T3Z937_TRIA4|nr:hypothetical protein M441DRAFT_89158 [Trichoderma asperellum CBS 433.97]PTB41317.1 hypothetical protein M441DRAFT_89158 [Trichoderma asperellum CBS 433.97]UKZ95216.1 hypothetical protein TrAFT101_010066 [Trichoderma asperellum]